MSAELLTVIPRAMAPFCRTALAADETAMPLDAATIGTALERFARRFERPDPAALASLWSMYYFNAALIPAAADLLCRDHILPVAMDGIGLRLDQAGLPEQVILPHVSSPFRAGEHGHRLDILLCGQLAPFVALMGRETGVTARVLWSNAATVLDWAVRTVGARALPVPRGALAAALAGDGPDGCRKLAGAFRETADGGRERRVCCMRYLLSDTSPCLPICPARDAAVNAGGRSALACGAGRL